MKTWFYFEVIDYFGFTSTWKAFAGTVKEAKEKLFSMMEYTPRSVSYLGNACYNMEFREI